MGSRYLSKGKWAADVVVFGDESGQPATGYLVVPCTADARWWIHTHLPEEVDHLGPNPVIEHWCIDLIVQAMREDGLVLGRAECLLEPLPNTRPFPTASHPHLWSDSLHSPLKL